MAGFTLEGTVLAVAHMTGSNADRRTGEVRPFDYHRVRLLLDDDVQDVKLDHLDGNAKYEGPVPEKGQTVSYVVTLGAWKDETSGRPNIAVRALRPSRPAAVAAPQRNAG